MLLKGKWTAQNHKFDCLVEKGNTGLGKRKEGEALSMNTDVQDLKDKVWRSEEWNGEDNTGGGLKRKNTS